MGKSYVENSLKRFLKRKVKITLGFVVAFMIMGTGVFAETISLKTEDITKAYGNGDYILEDDNVTITNNKWNVFSTWDIGKITVTVGENQTLTLVANGGGENVDDRVNQGVIKNTIINNSDSGEKFGTVILKNDNGHGLGVGKNSITADKVVIDVALASDGPIKATGITAYGTNTISANEISITSSHYGIQALSDVEGKIELKDFNSLDITGIDGHGIQNVATGKDCINIIGNANSVINITSKGSGTSAIANYVYSNNSGNLVSLGGNTAITGGTINLTSTGEITEGDDEIKGAVLFVTNGTTKLSANEIVIQAVNFDEKGEITELNKNGTAIHMLGGDLKINEGTPEEKANKIVKIYGNISADNGTIDLDLLNNSSIVEGAITANNDNASFEFSNGATWTNTGDSNVKKLTLNGGVINNTEKAKDVITRNAEDSPFYDIKIGDLEGTGGTFNIGAEINENGEAVSGKLIINAVKDENAHFDINYKGTDNLEVSQEEAKEYFEQLAKNVKVEDEKSEEFKATAKLEEGFVKGGYTADLVVDNKGNQVGDIDYKLNSMVAGMRDLATINLLTWRQEMSSLNQRMGELRNSTGEHGVWTRVYTGKIENGSQYDNEYQTYQVGYDKKYAVDNGTLFVGGLVSYSKGETNYSLGDGENYSVGAGVYTTWLNNDGYFADVILKQSRLHNKFDVRSIDGNKSQHGDYNNWGTSLSGQYGKRFDVNDKFFVEPSVQLTLGRVDDTTYNTSAGVDVHQDTMYSLIGNVGTAVGYKFSDKGNIYARASLVKEFQGDIDTTYSLDGATERTSEDLSDTWGEFGIGVNYRFVENMNVYADVQKTGAADVENEWQANLGFRYEF